jgi:hypothetical protein
MSSHGSICNATNRLFPLNPLNSLKAQAKKNAKGHAKTAWHPEFQASGRIKKIRTNSRRKTKPFVTAPSIKLVF